MLEPYERHVFREQSRMHIRDLCTYYERVFAPFRYAVSGYYGSSLASRTSLIITDSLPNTQPTR